MKIAVAYLRVSTEMQTEYSPDSQLRLIKDYAVKNNLILSEVYSDEGVSGRKVDRRPAFKRMIADAAKKKFDTILIYSTSRFARNHEESIVYRSMLKRDGIDVVSITQPSVDYKTDILMNALYAVMDERFSIDLSENVKRGMKEKVSRGYYISCAPLGYTRVEKNKPLIINEDESKIIRWIFDEYINGGSMFRMAKTLNLDGYRAKRGRPFDRRGIFRILSNPVYKGYLSWTCDGETIYTKADHEPIIDEAAFEKVQKSLDENTQKHAWKSRDSATCAHWLTGLIRCPECGTTYVFTKGYNGRSDRFRCGRYGNASCTNKHTVNVSVLEKEMLAYLENAQIKNVVYTKESSTTAVLESNLSNTAVQLEKSLERAKQAFLHGIDTVEEYRVNKEAITKEIENVKSLLKNGNQPVADIKPVTKKVRGLVDVLRSDSGNKTKNMLARSIISKIVANPKDNRFEFYFFG